MSKVYIIDAKRTAIGSFLGSLSEMKASELLGEVIKSILENNEVNLDEIDEVIVGNVLSSGQGQGIARQAAIYAGIPYEIPAYSINMVCGSGMKSIMNAYTQIKSGMSNIIIAGGVEVMSKAPFFINSKSRKGNKLGDMKMLDSLLIDGLTCGINKYHMGITAEKLASKYNITREEQDIFALNSQLKSINAIDKGKFKDEIVGIKVKNGKNDYLFNEDEYVNRNTSIQKLSKLNSVFIKDGTVTAGNSSGLNDGASAILIVSEDIVSKYNLNPLAEIIDFSQSGVDPSIMGIGPVEAITKLIGKTNLSIDEIDLIEINEAFAAQSLAVLKELSVRYSIDKSFIDEKVNVNGGSIALGHPLGASGTRVITTLCHEMKRRDSKYGIGTLCVGGGMGTAILVKGI